MPIAPHEIAPGIVHWTARHPKIGMDVSSYWLPGARTLLNPLAPEEGFDAALDGAGPEQVLLTNRHHWRDSGALVERFGATVRAPRSGLHEFADDAAVTPYDDGDELPGPAIVHVVGALSPDETAIHFPRESALALADGIVRWEPDGPLTFVPDDLIGDDPERVKHDLTAAYERLIALEAAHLLLAHGNPVVGDGTAALRRFVDEHPG